MRDKTSDKDVANIEIVIEDCREHLKLYGEAFITANELDRIEYILSDYTRQKQINEEHQKINGELRERVKELEEENTLQRRQLNSAFDNGYIHTDKIRKLIASETINISGFECIALEDLQELLGGESK